MYAFTCSAVAVAAGRAGTEGPPPRIDNRVAGQGEAALPRDVAGAFHAVLRRAEIVGVHVKRPRDLVDVAAQPVRVTAAAVHLAAERWAGVALPARLRLVPHGEQVRDASIERGRQRCAEPVGRVRMLAGSPSMRVSIVVDPADQSKPRGACACHHVVVNNDGDGSIFRRLAR